MIITANLIELWCAELHNKNTCLGQYYSEDDYSIKRYAKTPEELSQSILKAMEHDVDLDSIDITKVDVIEYDNKRWLGGNETNAEDEFKTIIGIKKEHYITGFYKNHPETIARLERERIEKKEREHRKKLERELELERYKRDKEERQKAAQKLANTDAVQELIKLAQSQGLKVDIK